MTEMFTRNVAEDFLVKNVPEMMDWASNSPGIYPIANLWLTVHWRAEKPMPKKSRTIEPIFAQKMEKNWHEHYKQVDGINESDVRLLLLIQTKSFSLPNYWNFREQNMANE